MTKDKNTLWNFSFKVFHEIQFQGHFMKHETLSWNTFTLVSKFHCVPFSSEKLYLLKFNSSTYYLLLKKHTNKNSERPKRIWLKPWLKNRNDKSACDKIFSELQLTDKFRYYLLMNDTSHTIDHTSTFIHWLRMHFILPTLIIMKHAFITSSYTHF